MSIDDPTPAPVPSQGPGTGGSPKLAGHQLLLVEELQPLAYAWASPLCREGRGLTRTLTVTSYLTLLPTSHSDRMALSPRTTPEKKSCWGMATLVWRSQNGA